MNGTKDDCDGRLERKKYLSLIAPAIPLKVLKERYRLKISGKQYTKAREHAKLHGAGTSTKIIPPPKPKLPEKISVLIEKHANDHSRPAANQTRKIKGKHVAAMIKLSNDSSMYTDFTEFLKEEKNTMKLFQKIFPKLHT